MCSVQYIQEGKKSIYAVIRGRLNYLSYILSQSKCVTFTELLKGKSSQFTTKENIKDASEFR